MTPEELIREGLASVGDEVKFRHWVALHGMPEAGEMKSYDRDLYLPYSLADLAFMAREKAGDPWWGRAIYMVGKTVLGAKPSRWWILYETTPQIWLLAGCLAVEMGKEKYEPPTD